MCGGESSSQPRSKILSGNRLLGVYNLLVVLFNNLYTSLISLCEYTYHLVHYILILTRNRVGVSKNPQKFNEDVKKVSEFRHLTLLT